MKFRDFVISSSDFALQRTAGNDRVARFKLSVQGILAEPVQCEVKWEPLQALCRAVGASDAVQQDAVTAGLALADVLLPEAGGIRNRFQERLIQARAEHGGIRLRLSLTGQLRNLPWEFMLINQAGGEATAADFLALDAHVSVVRQPAMPLVSWEIEPTDLTNIGLLAAFANPDDTAPLNLELERAGLAEILQKYPRIHPKYIMPATSETLLEGNDQFHLFHFAGHGVFTRQRMGEQVGTMEGQGFVILEDADGQRVDLAADRLGLFLKQRGVRVALLGACLTAQRDDVNQWSGVAEALLKADLGAVVGMQFNVKDVSAIAFMRKFYESLLAGLTIDEAVSAGRLMLAVAKDDMRGFGTPVLYLRDSDGVVMPELAHEPANQPTQAHIAAQADQSRKQLQQTRIDARYSKGTIFNDQGIVNQHFEIQVGSEYAQGDINRVNNGIAIDTAQINGDVFGGDKVSGDKIQGDNVGGDKTAGDKIVGDKIVGNKNTGKVNTGGGAYIGGSVTTGGDFIGRDKHVNMSSGVSGTELDALFAPLLAAVAHAPPTQQPQVQQVVDDLKTEAKKGSSRSDERVADLVENLVKLVPTAVSSVVSMFASPILSALVGPVTGYVLKKLRGQ